MCQEVAQRESFPKLLGFEGTDLSMVGFWGHPSVGSEAGPVSTAAAISKNSPTSTANISAVRAPIPVKFWLDIELTILV